MDLKSLLQLDTYGVGRRKLDDPLFADDDPPNRFGIYDLDDESLCHEVVKSTCQIPGCKFETDSLLDYENHYNASHRYTCSQCKKVLPSPHLLDLHIQEKHDSFFAVMAMKKPSYCCYIEECKEKFMNTDDRLNHCIKVHKLPKDFRFDQHRPKSSKTNRSKIKGKESNNAQTSMEVDSNIKEKPFKFSNSKQKAFVKYTGKKFTSDVKVSPIDVNMDDIVDDLKESLPE